jgi:hypothetical protein
MTKNTYATFFLVLSLLFASSLVHSAQVWDLYNFKVQPGKATAVLKAFNDLQMSEAGSNRMASVHLQQSVFGGSSGTPILSLPFTGAEAILSKNGARRDQSVEKVPGSNECQ